MLKECAKSCDSCKPSTPKKRKRSLAVQGNKDDLLKQTELFGTPQVADGAEELQTIARIQESISYMFSEEVMALSAKVKENCKNRHDLCTFWAVIGE